MSRSACVVGWFPDRKVTGATNLKPLFCDDLIEALKLIIVKQALGFELDDDEEAIVESLSEGAEEHIRNIELRTPVVERALFLVPSEGNSATS